MLNKKGVFVEMKQKLKVNSLNLFYIFVTVLLFCTCEILFVYFNFMEQSNTEKNEITYQTTSIAQELNIKLQAATANYVFYALDDDFNELFEETKLPYTIDYITQTQYVKDKIEVVLTSDSFLSDIGFVVNEKNLITVNSVTEIDQEKILIAAKNNHSSADWYTSNIYLNQSLSKNQENFFLLKDIVGLSTKEVVAQMVLLFSFSKVEEIILEKQNVFGKQVLLFEQPEVGTLEIIWGDSATSEMLQQAVNEVYATMTEDYYEQMIIVGNKTYYAAFQREQSTGWLIMSYYDVNEVFFTSLYENAGIYLLIGILFLIVLLIEINSFRFLNKTVCALRDAMFQMKQGRFVQLDWKLERETLLKDVVSGFNEMSQTLEETIYENFIAELARKEAELKMLHFQINPHFLYNSLNSIQSLAVLHDVPSVACISENMARLFQYNMQPDYVVTVRDEIELLKQYYAIQNIRFPNKTRVQWEIEEQVLLCEIGKFTLQPIFENIFKHATLHKKQIEIKVSAKIVDEQLYKIQIWNTRSGLSKAQVQEINERLSRAVETSSAENIGMGNVNKRIKLQYGEAYGIFIESEINSFFCANIMLPVGKMARKEKQDENFDS
ncbi:MAG: histidine kinase [Faecalibacterium sp.]